MRGVDTVIHLAAITGAASTNDRRDETFAVNRDGTDNACTAAGKLSVEPVAELVRDTLDRDLAITHLESEHPGSSYNVTFDRLGETGFEPTTTLREGVVDLADRVQTVGREVAPR
jgi:nucleoside-diphosphate-sugar epimerase